MSCQGDLDLTILSCVVGADLVEAHRVGPCGSLMGNIQRMSAEELAAEFVSSTGEASLVEWIAGLPSNELPNVEDYHGSSGYPSKLQAWMVQASRHAR